MPSLISCRDPHKARHRLSLIVYICGMHYVSVEDLTKSYGVKPLFQHITFHIEEGDKIALVARNGSGKSTLLRILSGKDTPKAAPSGSTKM
jgi:ATP-binding cassette subfamily F protein uup